MERDPAFLWYDADAARDVAHMNRLERGAYFDFIQAWLKFRGITVEQARKILGKDFDEVWGALELILVKDQEGKYHVPWVKNSFEKRVKFRELQTEKVSKYWKEKKKTKPLPKKNRGNTTVIPSVNAIEIANGDTDKEDKGGEGGKFPEYHPCIAIYADWYQERTGTKYPFQIQDGRAMKSIIAYLRTVKKGGTVEDSWRAVLQNFSKWDQFLQKQIKLVQIYGNLANIINSIKNGKQSFRSNTRQGFADTVNEITRIVKGHANDGG